jgi:hypothetical protein
MKRRKFLVSAAMAAAGSSLIFAFGKNNLDFLQFENTTIHDLAKTSDRLQAEFNALANWLRDNGWAAYLEKNLGLDLRKNGESLSSVLVETLDPGKLQELRSNQRSGFDDFTGSSLIKPGFPALSLLYHALASPRVRPAEVQSYPSVTQIDTLENYIYALADWEKLKAAYNVRSNEELVLAVFAYEYRPAFKTPHHEHADLVFSRTGVARIGEEPMNYDPQNRCYINKPKDPLKIKSTAVTPARFGLFLARKIKHDDIELMKTGIFKENDLKNDSNDKAKFFLQPVRKVFNNDLLVAESKLAFSEVHKSEKLAKLAVSKNFKIYKNLKPAIRESVELIEQEDRLRLAGSTFLVVSKPRAMIRHAKAGGQPLYFHVKKRNEENRYFTAYSTQEVKDIELLNGVSRRYNAYNAPRNQAMFVNITHTLNKDNLTFEKIRHDKNDLFEAVIDKGQYYAPLFEDSICDGRVDASLPASAFQKLKGVRTTCLPGFSIVTAPDFFPQVDPFDLVGFDVAPGPGKESNFFEGGVASLATARIRPNPKLIRAENDITSDTYTAVYSGKNEKGNHPFRNIYKDPASERGYYISGFLPDVSSSVFAPGWDVTYSKDERWGKEIYIGTEGLGSPFIEDMKFCAALNGMWPATSPDASRTYQGSHETEYRNPTAIPLLDEELGIHRNAPCTDKSKLNTLGWDGEQGPFLEKIGQKWKVNFTDIGRADAVQNALEGKLDMSQLRELSSAELIARMDCLRTCIAALPLKNFQSKEHESKMVAYTYLWLVSAEKVFWGKNDANAYGIPASLVGQDKKWIAEKSNAKIAGDGYLFVFADSAPDNNREWDDESKRRRLDCEKIYVCQVTNQPGVKNKIAWTEIKDGQVNWNYA